MNGNESPEKRYHKRLRARGICGRCYKPVEPERIGMIYCAKCAEKANRYGKARREMLRARGMCTCCGQEPAQEGRTLCLACGIKCTERVRAYQKRKKAQE